MRVYNVQRFGEIDGDSRLELWGVAGTFRRDKDKTEHKVYIASETAPHLKPNPLAFTLMAIPVSMAIGQSVVSIIGGETNYKALVREYMRITGYDKIRVTGYDTATQKSVIGRALFFTGGVDSWYTLAMENKNIDSLIYVDGLDIPLRNQLALDRIHREILNIGDMYDKQVFFLRTNLREFSDQFIPWEKYYGTALAAIAYTMAGHANVFYLSSGQRDADDIPEGINSALCNMWSTSAIRLLHYGADVSRMDKVLTLSDNITWPSQLRYCWQSSDGTNCGRCEKCVRTELMLFCAGRPLAETDSLCQRVEAINLPKNDRRFMVYWDQIIHRLELETGTDPLSVMAGGRRREDCKKILKSIKRALS